MGPFDSDAAQAALERHLSWWGVRRFTSDAEYFAWQRRTLSRDQVARLQALVETKQRTRAAADDVAFFDYSAEACILPVLYSQRYDYFLAVGREMAGRLGGAGHVLDVGCGPGILTTFYAAQCPGRTFLGLDRSRECIDLAVRRAAALALPNVRFVCADLSTWEPGARYDLIISSQALFQTEHDPGLPSRSWRTFERPVEAGAQRAFEQRTGLGDRLDRLRSWLAPGGRLLLFEKTGHLARRVPFQRALAARGFTLREPPAPIRYAVVEEVVEHESLYALAVAPDGSPCAASHAWSEAPVVGPQDELYRCSGEAAGEVWTRLPRKRAVQRVRGPEADPEGETELGVAAEMLSYLFYRAPTAPSCRLLVGGPLAGREIQAAFDRIRESAARAVEMVNAAGRTPGGSRGGEDDPSQTPLYENHAPAAQSVWESLPRRQVLEEATASEPDGRQLHVEYGLSGLLAFVYCANTFDQRQLVLMDHARRGLLEAYYAELLDANRSVLGRTHGTGVEPPGSP